MLFKIILNRSCCECNWFNICKAKFIYERKWSCPYVELARNMYPASDAKCWLNFSKVLLKYRTSWNISRSITAKFTRKKQMRKCLLFNFITTCLIFLTFLIPVFFIAFTLFLISNFFKKNFGLLQHPKWRTLS